MANDFSLANNNIYPTCMALLVARNMQHPVAQISVLPLQVLCHRARVDAASSHCRRRAVGDEQDEVKSAERCLLHV